MTLAKGGLHVSASLDGKKLGDFVEWKPVVLETPPGGQGAKLPFTEASNRRAIQTNNVEVDDRGYIYIVDRANTGMHILELTGDARKAAGLPWRQR